MDILLQDRLSALLFYISQWQKMDSKLENVEGFLIYLKTCDLGCFNVGNSKIWLSYHKEARNKGISIAQLLFEKQRNILTMEPRQNNKSRENQIFVLHLESKKELSEIKKRVKIQNPLLKN